MNDNSVTDLRVFAINQNAIYYFNSFKKDVAEGKVSNDGCNKLLNEIDKQVIYSKNKQFYSKITSGTALYRARIKACYIFIRYV